MARQKKIDLSVSIDSLSKETKQKLARFASATKQRESEAYRVYFKDGSHTEIPESRATITEYFAAREDLSTCPEPGIQKLVHLIQIERLDDAVDEASAGHIQNVYHLADNELVALGFKFQTAVKAKNKKPTRRRSVRRRAR
jgi:hypothetical protein